MSPRIVDKVVQTSLADNLQVNFGSIAACGPQAGTGVAVQQPGASKHKAAHKQQPLNHEPAKNLKEKEKNR
jgi:hypothetical protein